MNTPSERARLSLLCLLLLLMLGLLAFTAVNTFQAVRNLQQQYSAARSRDVSAIRPWMTIQMISHIYRVPEDYLSHSLNLSNPGQLRYVILDEIAHRKKQPVDQVIRTVQHAILAYRKGRPHYRSPTPTPTRHLNVRPLTPTPGRTNY